MTIDEILDEECVGEEHAKVTCSVDSTVSSMRELSNSSLTGDGHDNNSNDNDEQSPCCKDHFVAVTVTVTCVASDPISSSAEGITVP